MKNAIILHGKPGKKDYFDPNVPSPSNAFWFPWLQKHLLINGIPAATPEVPLAYEPKWEAWCMEVERHEIGPDTKLVGHSCGAGFWVRYLSERKDLRVNKVVLVGPWLDPDGDHTDGFFDFEIDPKLAERTESIHIFHSDNDMGNIHKTVAILRETIKDIEYTEFHNYGHFIDMDAFPELLKELLA